MTEIKSYRRTIVGKPIHEWKAKWQVQDESTGEISLSQLHRKHTEINQKKLKINQTIFFSTGTTIGFMNWWIMK